MDVILIAAVTVNGKIARNPNDNLEWSKDMKLFREQTMGHTVVMGSNTAKTLSKKLDGRDVVILHRDMEPKDILNQVKSEKCFIAGGGRTNSRFVNYLTHLYITAYPLIFDAGAVPLFFHLDQELSLQFERMLVVDKNEGIYQYQYRVLKL